MWKEGEVRDEGCRMAEKVAIVNVSRETMKVEAGTARKRGGILKINWRK